MVNQLKLRRGYAEEIGEDKTSVHIKYHVCTSLFCLCKGSNCTERIQVGGCAAFVTSTWNFVTCGDLRIRVNRDSLSFGTAFTGFHTNYVWSLVKAGVDGFDFFLVRKYQIHGLSKEVWAAVTFCTALVRSPVQWWYKTWSIQILEVKNIENASQCLACTIKVAYQNRLEQVSLFFPRYDRPLILLYEAKTW